MRKRKKGPTHFNFSCYGKKPGPKFLITSENAPIRQTLVIGNHQEDVFSFTKRFVRLFGSCGSNLYRFERNEMKLKILESHISIFTLADSEGPLSHPKQSHRPQTPPPSGPLFLLQWIYPHTPLRSPSASCSVTVL